MTTEGADLIGGGQATVLQIAELTLPEDGHVEAKSNGG